MARLIFHLENPKSDCLESNRIAFFLDAQFEVHDHNTSEAEQVIGCAELYYFRVKPKSNNKVSLKSKKRTALQRTECEEFL